MRSFKIGLFCLVSLFHSAVLATAADSLDSINRGNTKILKFRNAKKRLRKLYRSLAKSGDLSLSRTIYCGCGFNGKKVNFKSCNYKPKFPKTKKGKKNQRAYRIEWEHVVPAHAFGQSFSGWKDGKSHKECKKLSNRKCAAKMHPEFRRMEADIFNLFPAIGEVNAIRSNYSMAEIPGEVREFGGCDVEIVDRKIEPRKEVRGDIARIYFYMDWAYPGKGIISKKNRKLFESWNKEDPVSKSEILIAENKMVIQGNCNPFVLDCKKKTYSTGF